MPPYFEICCSLRGATPQPVSWLQRGGQWPGVGDVRARPGRSSPAAGLPCHSEGTKEPLMSRGPPLRTHSPVRAAGQNIPAASPPPAAPSYFRNRPRQIPASPPQGTLPSCMAEAKAAFCQSSSAWGGLLWGFLTSPSGIPHLPLPCGATLPRELQSFRKECGKGARCSCHPPWTAHSAPRVYSLPWALTSGYQCEFVLPGFKQSPLFKRRFISPVLPQGAVNTW